MMFLSAHLLRASTSRSLLPLLSCRCYSSADKKPEFRFSESSAYQGIDKIRPDPLNLDKMKKVVANIEDSVEYRRKKLFVNMLSIAILVIYFSFIRYDCLI